MIVTSPNLNSNWEEDQISILLKMKFQNFGKNFQNFKGTKIEDLIKM